MRLRKVFLAFILFCQLSLFAQYYNMGQDASSVRWRMIKTKECKIIYPEGFDSVAFRFASTLSTVYDPVYYSMKKRPWRFSIVMHNQLCTSNGFVALAPRRMELYNMPSQSDFALDWYQSLALHETRHIVQFDKLGSKLGMVLHVLWGQQAVAALAGISTPAWFFEGDAVCSETGLSHEGRGRSAAFNAGLRAQLLDKKTYSYSKAMFGSYKHFVPNHYVLGYYLVANGRKKYSADMWQQAVSPTALFGNFGRPIKVNSGRRRAGYYRQTMGDLQQIWDSISKKEQYSMFDSLLHVKRSTYTNYRYPVQASTDESHSLKSNRYYAVKSGFSNYEDYISIDEQGNEILVFRFGRHQTGDIVSKQKNMVAWIENTPDLRWEMRSRSNVMTYNLETGEMKQITHDGRYQAPSISPDAQRVAVVEVSETNSYAIKILDIKTGLVLQRLQTPLNEYPLTPNWQNDSSVVAVFIGQDGKRIAAINIYTNQITEYKSKTYEELSQPSFWRNYLLYISSYSGANNVYAYDTLTKQTFRVSSVRYGMQNYSISSDNNSLLFSNYTADGYEPVKMPFDTRSWTPIAQVSRLDDGLYNHLSKDEQAPPRLDTITQRTYVSKPYHRLPHFLNIHSWGLRASYGEVRTDELFNSISILSQDKLSTTEIEVGHRSNAYFSQQKYATVRYMGLFPIFEISGYKGKQTMSLNSDYLTYLYLNDIKENTYDVENLRTTVIFPFTFSRGVWSRYATVNASYQYSQFAYNETTRDKFGRHYIPNYSSDEQYVSTTAQISQYYKTRVKDLLPQFGQFVRIGYSKEKSSDKKRLFVNTKLYLPGLTKHHSILLTADFQFKTVEIENYSVHSLADAIPLARGTWFYTSGLPNTKQLQTYTLNYNFTLANPDFSLGSILYLKRMKINLFYDYTRFILGYQSLIGSSAYRLNTSNEYSSFYSYGYELKNEINVFRLALPIDIGWRQSYSAGTYYTSNVKYEVLFALRINDL